MNSRGMPSRWRCPGIAVERDFTNDPLCYTGQIKAAIGHAMTAAAADTRARLRDPTLPLFAMHGTADRLIDPAGTHLLHTQSASPDKTLHH
ncbi:MAG: alpha/beta hydrolase [Chloroflexia bacterium]|nr:alpha/beta hydrolase [Chloroflexia bacterium]